MLKCSTQKGGRAQVLGIVGDFLDYFSLAGVGKLDWIYSAVAIYTRGKIMALRHALQDFFSLSLSLVLHRLQGLLLDLEMETANRVRESSTRPLILQFFLKNIAFFYFYFLKSQMYSTSRNEDEQWNEELSEYWTDSTGSPTPPEKSGRNCNFFSEKIDAEFNQAICDSFFSRRHLSISYER